MGIFKKKDESKGKKPVKVVPVDVNPKKKNPNMWCAMHNCPKTGCPTMHD